MMFDLRLQLSQAIVSIQPTIFLGLLQSAFFLQEFLQFILKYLRGLLVHSGLCLLSKGFHGAHSFLAGALEFKTNARVGDIDTGVVILMFMAIAFARSTCARDTIHELQRILTCAFAFELA